MIKFESGDLKGYKARLLDRQILPANPERANIWADGFLKPRIGKAKYKWKKINLTVEYSGTSVKEIEDNKAVVQDKLDNSYIRFADIPAVRYFVILEGEPSISTNYHGRFQAISYNLLGYAEDENETVRNLTGATNTITLDNKTLETPAIIEVSGNNTVVVKINEDIFDVKAIGTTKVIIGDGKVMKNNSNHWNNVDFGRFPRLRAGANTIEITPATAKVTLKYRRRLK